MPNEEFNSLEDLVFSRSFRNWLLNPEGAEADFWTNWVTLNPDRPELVNQAKAVIYALRLNLRPVAEGTVDAEVRKALQKLKEGRASPVREVPLQTSLLGRHVSRAWTVAAVIAAVAVCAILFGALRRYLHRDDFYHSFLATNAVKKSIRQVTADSGAGTRIALPDGGTVRLIHGSRLSWPEGSSAVGHQRVVFLEGEAFFDIVHDASKPFFVYTSSIVIKVLGTRFSVNPGKTGITVSVGTGKVSVYHRTDLSDGIILTANQQVTYDPDKEHFDKRLVPEPKPLAAADTGALAPGPTPVALVLHRLQNRYGIPIVFDEDGVSGCNLSTGAGNESFYEQLTKVCKTVKASYEVIDGTIVVTAKGCR